LSKFREIEAQSHDRLVGISAKRSATDCAAPS
jgi:hypothetical protein